MYAGLLPLTHQDTRSIGFFVVLDDPLLSGFLHENKIQDCKHSGG